MAGVVYEVVEHDGGWAYKVGDVFSERFATHDEARAAADDAAQRHQLSGETELISFQDPEGEVHIEVASGKDRPTASVEDSVAAEDASPEAER